MSKVASKRPSTQHPAQHRAPLTSDARARRRSIPEVDDMPPRVREQLHAAALTSNHAQLAALKQVHTMLRSQRSLMIATLAMIGALVVAMSLIAIVGALRIDGAERRIDSAERRVERLENFHQESTR